MPPWVMADVDVDQSHGLPGDQWIGAAVGGRLVARSPRDGLTKQPRCQCGNRAFPAVSARFRRDRGAPQG